MTQGLPDLSVLISSHNTRVFLEPCLRSVLEEIPRSGLQTEVIVVDDASTDGTAEMVAGMFPEAKLIRCLTNEGYARTNNIGINRAAGRAVLLLNSDTVVVPGAFMTMFETLHRSGDIAAVGPMLLNPDGSLQRSCWPFPLRALTGNALGLFRTGLWDDFRHWDHRRDRYVDCISSTALMIRRSALEDVGWLDERFWVYGVDIDWAMRARAKRYRLLALASARVIHHGGASWGSVPIRMMYDHFRSHDLLFRKHYGWPGFLLYRSIIFVTGLLRLIFWGLPYLFGKRHLGGKLAHFQRLIQWSLLGNIHETKRAS